MTGETYKRLLRYYTFPKFQEYQEDTIFQQDGAPLHLSVLECQCWYQKYANRWTGIAGPISWPPCSPDMTPCDYFLWRYLKYIRYCEPPNTISELMTKITYAVASIYEDTLKKSTKTWKTVYALYLEKEVVILNNF